MKLIIVDPIFSDKIENDILIKQLIEDSGCLVKIYSTVHTALQDLKTQKFKADYIILDSEVSILIGFGLFSFVNQKTKFFILQNKKKLNFKDQELADSLYRLTKDFNFRFLNEKLTLCFLENLLKDSNKALKRDIYLAYSKKEYHLLETNSIKYIKSIGDYVQVVTTKKKLIVYTTLKKVQERLPHCFLRPHRGYLVNNRFVTKVSEEEMVLNNRTKIPITKSRFKDVLLKLNGMQSK